MPFSPTPEDQVQRLKNQMGWVTRLSAALGSTKDPGDIFSMVLTGVVSPACLGYSAVLYFEFEKGQGSLRGHCALAHESLENYNALARELVEESQYIRDRSDSQDEVRLPNLQEEELFTWLADNSQWVTLSQRLSVENPLTEQVRRVVIDIADAKPPGGQARLLEDAPYWRGARSFSKTRLANRMHPGLASLLPEHFAAAPLFSHEGLRGILLVDRRLHSDQSFSVDELSELDWFSRQAALALENAAMNADLKSAYEDLKQLDTMKSNFLSVISHELRTPLTAMGGFVELIVEERVGPINENQRTLLSRVAKNTHHLSHLVNDLIEMAQIQAEGAVEVRLSPVEPLAVLMDTLPKLEQRRRESDVRVEPVVECDVPKILTDERALGRILFHLLDNAMKFSPPGGVVEVRFSAENGDFYIAIKDQGVGIPRNQTQRIFDHFYQVDNTLTRGFEGLGLGLSVTRFLLQATKGKILVESREGQGSTFTIIYPVA
jgi:signal transduction histidine kinase